MCHVLFYIGWRRLVKRYSHFGTLLTLLCCCDKNKITYLNNWLTNYQLGEAYVQQWTYSWYDDDNDELPVTLYSNNIDIRLYLLVIINLLYSIPSLVNFTYIAITPHFVKGLLTKWASKINYIMYFMNFNTPCSISAQYLWSLYVLRGYSTSFEPKRSSWKLSAMNRTRPLCMYNT